MNFDITVIERFWQLLLSGVPVILWIVPGFRILWNADWSGDGISKKDEQGIQSDCCGVY